MQTKKPSLKSNSRNNKSHKFFSQDSVEWFPPSLHWQHCLLLEKGLLQLLEYVPIDPSMPKENLSMSSPKLVDIFTKACFLLEAAFKGISNDPTERVVRFLLTSNSSWSKNLLNGLNCSGKETKLDICDFLSFYEQYCSLSKLKPRIRYFGHISDVWINEMLISHPFGTMKTKGDCVTEPPDWWTVYNKIKHNFYSYPRLLTLEITLVALAGLISFTAVVPQVRRLLCDHGFIKDDSGKPVPLDLFGRRVDDQFKKDEWTSHDELVFKDHLNDQTLPPVACVSNLFIVQFAGDYKTMKLWTGLH
jgi:hypothetical protein